MRVNGGAVYTVPRRQWTLAMGQFFLYPHLAFLWQLKQTNTTWLPPSHPSLRGSCSVLPLPTC